MNLVKKTAFGEVEAIRLVRWITMGNVSFANMVRSAMCAT